MIEELLQKTRTVALAGMLAVMSCSTPSVGTKRESNYHERTFSITLPIQDNSGKAIRPEVYQTLAATMSDHFGGVSVQLGAYGCWHDKEHRKLLCEQNLVFSSSRDCEDTSQLRKVYGTGDCQSVVEQHDWPFVEKIAKAYGRMLGQSSIYVREIVDEIRFVTGEWKETLPERLLVQDKELTWQMED